MKKTIYSLLLALVMLFCATTCLAAEENSYLIYKNNDFEDHNVGDLPGAFNYHWFDGNDPWGGGLEQRLEAYHNVEIIQLEKDGNAENKAVRLNPDLDQVDLSSQTYTSTVRAIFTNYPMKGKGVIGFSFMVNDSTQTKYVKIGRNAVTARHLDYVDNGDQGLYSGKELLDDRYVGKYGNWRSFIEIRGGKAYYKGNGSVELGTVENNTWYDIDIVVDIPSKSAKIYFDGGTPVDVSLPGTPDTVNIYEVRFDLPTTEGDVWYLDDLRIYEADGVVDDSILDAQWNEYRASSFYGGYEFESSRATQYDYMAYMEARGKKFALVNTNRFFDGSTIQKLPAKIHYQDGVLMAPVCGLADALGATATADDATGEVTLVVGEKIVRFIPDSTTYYINDKPALLRIPAQSVDGTVCIQSDVLFGLLGEDYTLQEDILWFGEQLNEFDWHMPLSMSGTELAGTSNLSIEENIYQRILRMFLYDRPTDEEIAAAITTAHPRIMFTTDLKNQITKMRATDSDLDRSIKKITSIADEIVDNVQKEDEKGNPLYNDDGTPIPKYPDFTYSLGGRGIAFDGIGNYFENLAFGYLMSDNKDDKAAYKEKILHHLNYFTDPDQFKDWGIQYNSGLNTGCLAYGLAYAYDWVDWTDEEKAMIKNACDRNIFDHALHAYTCSIDSYQLTINFGEGNMALITNGGILMLAVAMYELDPDYYTDVIRGALRSAEGGTLAYFPDGAYPEGVSYWRYAETYLGRVLTGLKTSMGTTWGITDIPGVIETATFTPIMKGANSAYAYGDGQPEKLYYPILMFAANHTGNKNFAQIRKAHLNLVDGNTLSMVDIANWVYDAEAVDTNLGLFDHNDIYSKGNETVVMRTGLTSADTSVAFHGGANNDPHGHMDIGSFQFDMNGVRFGMDLDREDYNLRDKGHKDSSKVKENYPEDRFPSGYPYTGGHYYRQKGEGHNTVVANRSVINATDLYNDVTVEATDETTGETTTKTISVFNYTVDKSGTYDMNPSAKSEFIDMKLGDDESFAVLNMTETNDIFDCAIRGVKLDKVNNIIYIQDDFTAKTATDFLWSMHTPAANFEYSNNNRTVILTSGGKKIKATIVDDNGCGFEFEDLPASFDTTYGSDVKPLVETANPGVSKLAVRTPVGENITRFKLTVAIQPYDSTAVPEFKPIETWE